MEFLYYPVLFFGKLINSIFRRRGPTFYHILRKLLNNGSMCCCLFCGPMWSLLSHAVCLLFAGKASEQYLLMASWRCERM